MINLFQESRTHFMQKCESRSAFVWNVDGRSCEDGLIALASSEQSTVFPWNEIASDFIYSHPDIKNSLALEKNASAGTIDYKHFASNYREIQRVIYGNALSQYNEHLKGVDLASMSQDDTRRMFALANEDLDGYENGNFLVPEVKRRRDVARSNLANLFYPTKDLEFDHKESSPQKGELKDIADHLEHQVSKGGPTEDEYPKIEKICDTIYDHAKSGTITPEQYIDTVVLPLGPALSCYTEIGRAHNHLGGGPGDCERIAWLQASKYGKQTHTLLDRFPYPKFNEKWCELHDSRKAAEAVILRLVQEMPRFLKSALDTFGDEEEIILENYASGSGYDVFANILLLAREGYDLNRLNKLKMNFYDTKDHAIRSAQKTMETLRYVKDFPKGFLDNVALIKQNVFKMINHFPPNHGSYSSGLLTYASDKIWSEFFDSSLAVTYRGGRLHYCNFSAEADRKYLAVTENWHFTFAGQLGLRSPEQCKEIALGINNNKIPSDNIETRSFADSQSVLEVVVP